MGHVREEHLVRTFFYVKVNFYPLFGVVCAHSGLTKVKNTAFLGRMESVFLVRGV